MKQFRLISCVLLFVLIITCFVNIYFYRISIREMETRREERMENLAAVYADEFRKMGLLVRNLNNNRLVEDLRYEHAFDGSASRKYQSLISALSLIETSYSESIQPFVYFHSADTIVTSNGKMQPELLGLTFVLGEDFDIAQFAGDRTKEIRIIPGIGVYFNTNYAQREQSDWGTMYVYTQDDVSVMALSHNMPLGAMLSVAIQDADNRYAIWDSAVGQVILSSVDALLGAECADVREISAALMDGMEDAVLSTLERGRFTYVLVENNTLDSLVSLQINVALWVTVTLGLIFSTLYSLILHREVFRPLASILGKLQLNSRQSNEYDAIEDAIFNMQGRISSLSRSLQSVAAQERETRIHQALLGTEGEAALHVPEGGERFALVSIIAERAEDVRTAGEWICQRFGGQLIANMDEQRVYLLWFDEVAQYRGFLSEMERIPAERFALGISRDYNDLMRIREAYQESCDVVHVRSDGERELPIFYVAGRDATDTSVGVPMNARDSGMLLSTIANGDVEAATQFVSEILDSDRALTIAQNRYRATYMLNVLSMAQNTQRESVFDLTVQTSRIRALVSGQTMRRLVLDACAELTRTFSEAKEDVLIRSIRSYVEEHYAENIYLKTIAEETGLSYAYISHYFSERQGIGFADYLNSVRVEKACEMLVDLRIPLNEIAERVGFGSMNTFVRNMKKFTGMTPDAYRKAHAKL